MAQRIALAALLAGAFTAATLTPPMMAYAQPMAPALCDSLAGDPDDPDLVGAGVTTRIADLDAAEAACREAVEAFPQEAHYIYTLARILFYQGDLEEAHTLFTEASDLGSAIATQWLGEMAWYGDLAPPDFAEAVGFFETAADAGIARAYWYLGSAYQYGRGVEADEEHALDLFAAGAGEGNVDAILAQAWLLTDGVGIEDFPTGVALFEEIIQAGDPNYLPTAQNNLAYLYAMRGENLEEALALAEAARDAVADDLDFRANIFDTLALIEFGLDRTEDAMNSIKTAILLSPERPEFQARAGEIAAAAGFTADARAYYGEAIRLYDISPNDVAPEFDIEAVRAALEALD